jgi:hypothetical protein
MREIEIKKSENGYYFIERDKYMGGYHTFSVWDFQVRYKLNFDDVTEMINKKLINTNMIYSTKQDAEDCLNKVIIPLETMRTLIKKY